MLASQIYNLSIMILTRDNPSIKITNIIISDKLIVTLLSIITLTAVIAVFLSIKKGLSKNKVILCDEPTASLDRMNTIKFMESLLKIKTHEKATIIMVTHDESVFEYGDVKLKILDGKIA